MEKKANELDKIPNGVFFIEDAVNPKTECRKYTQLTPDTVVAPTATKYIGVKMGDHAIAIALADIPGDKDGKLPLLPQGHHSPTTSENYVWDSDRQLRRFNVFEDFDGMGNTEHLKAAGCTIPIPDEEWIPSMGEIGIIMMNLGAVNRALKLAGGQQLTAWYWSSTEHSQNLAWIVVYSDGFTDENYKFNSFAVRAVASF